MVKSKKEAKNLKFGDHEFRNFNMDEGSLLDPEMESRIEDFIKQKIDEGLDDRDIIEQFQKGMSPDMG